MFCFVLKCKVFDNLLVVVFVESAVVVQVVLTHLLKNKKQWSFKPEESLTALLIKACCSLNWIDIFS